VADLLTAMTIYVEDCLHVAAFADIVSADHRPSFKSRVWQNSERLLEMFGQANVHATFFFGFVATIDRSASHDD